MMKNSSKESKFKLILGLSLSASFLLFISILLLSQPISFDNLSRRTVILLFIASIWGYLFRVFRRKFFFRKRISFHRSFSYEAVVQSIHLFSPFFPRRAFEAEFLESNDHICEERVLAWLALRSLSSLLLSAISVSLIIFFFFKHFLAFLPFILVIFLIFRSRDILSRRLFDFFLMIFSAAMIWGGEFLFFYLGTAEFISIRPAISLYALFTGFFEFSPAPFGLGVVELPAILIDKKYLPILLLFHLFRVVLPLFFGWIYLRRYKFSASDFFHPSLLKILALRKIPRENSPTENAKIAIIIPAYNEEKRLPSFLSEIAAYSRKNANIATVIVVDDGSSDNTAKIAKEISEEFTLLKVISNEKNRGKGFSVKKGIIYALDNFSPDYVLYADADGATPIDELDNLMTATITGSEIVIASRTTAKAKRNGFRAIAGKSFYAIVNLLAIPGIEDSQCGFKLFKNYAARKIFSRSLENSWAFDVEIIYIAQMLGYKISQIPVRWTEQPGSKVKIFRDSLKMLVAVFRIRSRHGGLIKDA